MSHKEGKTTSDRRLLPLRGFLSAWGYVRSNPYLIAPVISVTLILFFAFIL